MEFGNSGTVYGLITNTTDKDLTGGVTNLAQLTGNQVYATLLPSGAEAPYQAGFNRQGAAYTLTASALNNGTVLYIKNTDTTSAPVATLAGAALTFDGASNYVAVGPKFAAVTNNFTMECWVNPATTINLPPQAVTGVSGVSGQHYAIYPTQGATNYGAGHSGAGLSVGTNGVAVYEHTANLLAAPLVYSKTLAGWTHLAVVYTNGVASLYINGIFAATGVKSNLIVHPSADMSSGASSSSNAYGYYKGQIDEVRLWNRSRSITDINADGNASLQGNETGLTAYYRLDDHTTTVTDATGHGNTGTLTNGDVNANYTQSGAAIDTVHALPGIPALVTLAGFDYLALPMTFSITSNPAHGAFTGSSPTFTYTPDGSYAGSDVFQYKATDSLRSGASASVNINYGPSSTLSGAVKLDSISPNAAPQSVTFQFTPNDSSPAFTRTVGVGPSGAFSLPLLPKRGYSVRVKGAKWLAAAAPADLTGGDASGFNLTLPAGDANNDNSVDSTDFGILIGAFNSDAVSGGGYDVGADFNCDGFVDSTDFGILIGNFNQQGAE